MSAQIQYAIREMRQHYENAITQLNHNIEQIQAQLQSDPGAPFRPRTIDDIPGMRIPRWEVVQVPFAEGDTGSSEGSTQINPDGPFIVTQVDQYWEVTDTDDAHFAGGAAAPWTGRVLPLTAQQMFSAGTSATAGENLSVLAANVTDQPEFSSQLSVTGSGRFWTSNPVPAAHFGKQGLGDAAMFVGTQGWVERTDRLKVTANALRAVPHAGIHTTIFAGYQILGHISLRQALGLQ